MIRRVYNWCVPAPFTIRAMASVALGAGLGMLYAGSPAWIVCVALILLFRTHLPSVVLGWLVGGLVGLVAMFAYVPVGRHILLGAEPFWRALLVQPVICYFDLNQARMMGSVAAALAAMAVAATWSLAASRGRK